MLDSVEEGHKAADRLIRHTDDFDPDELCRPTGQSGFLTVRGFWMHSNACVRRWWPDRETYPDWEAE